MDLTKITSDNFNESFKINEVLLNSVFYPASHLDGIGIELFSQEFNSYVHADYSTPREMVYNAMFNHFSGVGYDLVGIKDISKNELNPGGYTPSKITMTEYENEESAAVPVETREYTVWVEPDSLPGEGRYVRLVPTEAERTAIAKRLGLLGLPSFEGKVHLRPTKGGGRGVKVTGAFSAKVVQACVVSLEPVEAAQLG